MARIYGSGVFRPRSYTLKSTEKSHQLIYGSNVVLRPKGWVTYENPNHPTWNRSLLLSAWEIDDVVQVVLNGTIVNPSRYELLITGVNSGDSTKFDYMPTVSLLSFDPSIFNLAHDVKNYEEMMEQMFVTVNGIKHYAYDSSGNVLTSGSLNDQAGNNPDTSGDGDGKACGHKMSGSSPEPVTNPAWVLAHLLMNEAEFRHDEIDWASFKDIADWLEDPVWSTANPNNGYDINLTINEPTKLDDIIKKIIPPSVYLRGAEGKVRLGRRYETTNSKHAVALHFTDDTILEGSFSVHKTDPYDVPTKTLCHYLKKEQDNQGRWITRKLQKALYSPFAQTAYGKKQAAKIDLSHYYDPDDFESVGGESVPMLETLFYHRKNLLGTDSFSFETGDLRAIFLEYGDAITFTTTFNTQTFTNQQATVRSIEFIEGKGMSVRIHADIHDDGWYNPDPNAPVSTSLSITTTGPQDFPEFRFKTDPATPTGTITTFKIAPRSGSVLDHRAIKPGMVIWQYSSSWLTPSTERYFADPSNWRLLGHIESFDASTNEITLTGPSTQGVNANWLVMITPNVSATSSTKMGRVGGRSGLWQVQYYFAKPDWFWFGQPLIETCEGEGSYNENDTYWEKWSGSSELLDDDGVYSYRGAAVMPIEINEGGYVTTQDAAFGSGTMFPLSMRFRRQNKYGEIPSSEKYVYAWPVSLPVSKSFSAIELNAQTNYDLDDNTGSDWTETFGISLQTNYDESSHGAHVEFVIKWSASPINSGNFEAAATFYDGVPKKTINDPEPVKSALGAVLYFALKTRAAGGDYTQTSSVDNLETIALTKRSRIWRKYSGTINEYNGAGGDRRGAGILLCTNEWENYATSWNNDDPASSAGSDLFAAGMYMYGQHRPAQAADVDLWRRWSYNPSGAVGKKWYTNGPVFAFESTGDFKLGHYVYSNNANALQHSNEQGCFGFSLNGDQTLKGEFLFGVGKRDDNMIGVAPTSGRYGEFSVVNYQSTQEYRSAAIAITRSGAASGRVAGLDVIINGAIMPGFLLSATDNIISKTYDSALSRFFFMTKGNITGSSLTNFQPLLMSYSKVSGSVGGLFHTYVVVDGKNGNLVFDNMQSGGSEVNGLNLGSDGSIGMVFRRGLITNSMVGGTEGSFVQRRMTTQRELGYWEIPVKSIGPSGADYSGRMFARVNGSTYTLEIYMNGGWRSAALT